MKFLRWLFDTSSEPVCVHTAPNVPLAEMLCGMLQTNGIPAYYKRSMFAGTFGRSTDFGSATIWVSPAEAERARSLLPKA